MFAFWLIAALAVAYALSRKGGDSMSTVPLPEPRPEDWAGWVWPVPVTDGRIPVISQEWKPGHDPGFGHSSGKTSNHLGVDITFRRREGDPAHEKHTVSQGGGFVSPPGTLVIAAGPGKVWSTGKTGYGLNILIDHGRVNQNVGGVNTWYQHLAEFAREWKHGDIVHPGDVLGVMGFASSQGDGEEFRHLHFELRLPRVGYAQNAWRIDPAPYMRFWRKVDLERGVA